MAQAIEFGLDTFGDVTVGPDGSPLSQAQVIRDIITEGVLADELGLDFFGVGEHHRADFAISAPETVLAGLATVTQRIHLGTAVTVLSSDDPVRVFQNYATLDLLSNGRAEIMAGRGSFLESFPLFGYDLHDYDELFAEKLELLLLLREAEAVTWSGRHRPALNGQGVYPRPVQAPLPVWVAVGGTPQSVVRAGMLGLSLALAIIGGRPEQFVPLANLYREAGRRAGHPPARLALSINSHGFIGDDSQQAADDYFPTFMAVMSKIGRERGWPPITRQQFEASRTLRGSDFVGNPDAVIEKILFQHELFGHQRLLLQLGVGTIAHTKMMRAVELLGTRVAPVVRAEIQRRAA